MTQEERNSNTKKVAQAIDMTCGDNEDAKAYLWSIARIARIVDDHVDGDHETDITRLVAEAMIALPSNAFFLRNASSLVPLQAVALNAWLDSNAWTREGGEKAQQALVLRDYVNELVQMVALILGGWDHMRNVSLTVRNLFFKTD